MKCVFCIFNSFAFVFIIDTKLSIEPPIYSAKIFAASFAEWTNSNCSNCSTVSCSPISMFAVEYPSGIDITES